MWITRRKGQRIASRAQTGQIEGPIFAETEGKQVDASLTGAGGVGRSVDAAWPLFGRRHFASQSWPTLRRPPFTHPCLLPTIHPPLPPLARTPPPPPSLLPCCALSVSPFSCEVCDDLLVAAPRPRLSPPRPSPLLLLLPSFDSPSLPPSLATPVLLNGENYQTGRFPSGSKHRPASRPDRLTRGSSRVVYF